MTQLIFYSLIGGLFSLVGGVLLLARADLAKRFILPLLSFGAGAFLAAAFLDILPEAIELVDEPHPVLVAALGGFVAFFAIERLLMRFSGHDYEHHDHADHTEHLPALLITGDGLHNFLDGILIALTYVVDPALGLITTLAVAAHEIPQEIGDFSILLNQGWQKSQILLVNVLLSLLTVAGAIFGYYAGIRLEPTLPYLLAAAGGIFLYIAASDLIPEIHHKAGHKHAYSTLIPLGIGIAAVWLLTSLAHG